MSQTFLINGASGFMGSEVVRRVKPSFTANQHVLADITVPSSLAPLMDGVATVIHAAGLAHIFHATPD